MAEKGEAGVLMLAVIVLFIVGFYLTSAPVKAIRVSTWTMMIAVFSLFLSILVTDLVNKLIVLISGDDWKPDGATEDPGWTGVLSTGVQMMIWWWLALLILLRATGSPLHAKGYCMVLGHVVAFACTNFFGDLSLSEPFRDSAWMLLILTLILCVGFALLFGLTLAAGKCFSCCLTQEESKEWHGQAKDFGLTFYTFGIAFLLCIFFRYAITGEVQAPGGTLGAYEGWPVWILMGIGILGLIVSMALSKVNHSSPANSTRALVLSHASTGFALIFSFCELNAVMWAVHAPSALMAHLSVALIFSFVAIAVILKLGLAIHMYPATKPELLQGLFAGIALPVGASWKGVFCACMADLGTFVEDHDKSWTRPVVILVTCLMLVIIFPAWLAHMFPKTNPAVQQAMSIQFTEEGGLPCRAFCCARDLYDDYEETEEEEEEEEEALASLIAPFAGK